MFTVHSLVIFVLSGFTDTLEFPSLAILVQTNDFDNGVKLIAKTKTESFSVGFLNVMDSVLKNAPNRT